jgi:hypothetical protein
MVALLRRFRSCRTGYSIEFNEHSEPVLRLADHSVARLSELSDSMSAFVDEARAGLVAAGCSAVSPSPPLG